MIRTIIASAATLAMTAGIASADGFVYHGGGYVASAPHGYVERRAAVIPDPGFAYVEPAPRVLVVPQFNQLSPGAPSGQSANDEKRTVADDRRDQLDRFYRFRSRPGVVYR